jgi:hypothetical protein
VLVRSELTPAARSKAWGAAASDTDRLRLHVVPMASTDGADLEAATAASLPEGLAAAFITLGVGKPSTSTPAELTRVDVTLPTAFARAAWRKGTLHVSLLTSVGADATATSWTGSTAAGGGLYVKAKGDVENNVAALGFPRGVSAIRPGALLGNANTPDVAEKLMPWIDPWLPKRMRSIHIDNVASAMIEAAVRAHTNAADTEESEPAANISYEGEELVALARARTATHPLE